LELKLAYSKNIASVKNKILEQKFAIEKLAEIVDNSINKAIDLLYKNKGKIVITGLGKSGHIGLKISATLSSTGSPSVFINCSEASHGDLGIIEKNDIIIALSKSGETNEMFPIINFAKTNKVKLIGITSNSKSFLAKNSNITCLIPNLIESCPLNLAPTTSTTMMLVLGDTIAIELMKKNNFKKEHFKKYHPGGMLGKRLLAVKNIMHTKNNIPLVYEKEHMRTALLKMTSIGFGCVGIINSNNELKGIITDGDLRRNIKKNFLSLPVEKIMTKNPLTININLSVMDAINLMNKNKITALFITESNSHKPTGIVHIHDCLKIG